MKCRAHFLIILVVALLCTSEQAPATLIGISSSVGTVSGADTEPLSVYEINPTTGAATLVTTTEVFGRLMGATFLDNALYVSNVAIGGPAPGPGGGLIGPSVVGTIDLMSGAFNTLNTQGGDINWNGFASNEAAELLYSVDGQQQALRSMTEAGLISTIGPSLGMEGLVCSAFIAAILTPHLGPARTRCEARPESGAPSHGGHGRCNARCSVAARVHQPEGPAHQDPRTCEDVLRCSERPSF